LPFDPRAQQIGRGHNSTTAPWGQTTDRRLRARWQRSRRSRSVRPDIAGPGLRAVFGRARPHRSRRGTPVRL